MGDYDPYDDADLTEEEIIQAIMGKTIEIETPGDTLYLEMSTNKIPMTKEQAGIIVEALRRYEGEAPVQQETARRTQTLLKQKFDIE